MWKAIWIGGFLLLAAAPGLQERNPQTILWAAPSILLASMLIAWAAESAQFFIAIASPKDEAAPQISRQ